MLKQTGPLWILFALLLPAAHSAETALAGAEQKVVRLSEPVQSTDTYEVFGAPMSDTGNAVTLRELVSNDAQYLGREVLLSTRIAKVCQKKGCFFIAQDGDAVARITFKDYSFFIPTDSTGKEVTLAGTFTRQQLNGAKARHYYEDLGEAPPETPGTSLEYQVVATSVRIPK
jgi:hypothetical protein